MNLLRPRPFVRAWPWLLLCLCPSAGVEAQSASPVEHVVYVEALGNALYGGSVNYERMLPERLSARVGASPFGAFPVMINYLPGRGGHAAEVGLGILLGSSEGRFLGTATLGYRYQPAGGGMVFRVGWTPVFGTSGVAGWAGASAGFAF